MPIHVALQHVTEYRYDRLVDVGPQTVRLRPAPHCRTHILSYALKVEPEPHTVHWQQDPQANYVARVVFPGPVRELRFEVALVAEIAVQNPFEFLLEPAAEQFPFSYEASLHSQLTPYMVRLEDQPRLVEYAASIPRESRGTVDFLVALNLKLSREIAYLTRHEPGVQTPDTTLQKGSGSCRDSAWLLAQSLRHVGLASRFVSGYLIPLTPEMKSLDGPSGSKVDFTELHAWCEVYLPGGGWIGLDPSAGLLAGEGHIPLACTPEPASAAPIEGMVGRSEVELKHHIKVERVPAT